MKTLTLVTALAMPAIVQAGDFPANWQAFKESPIAEDKKLVAGIEKAASANPFKLCAEWGRGERAKKETRRNRAVFEFLLFKNYLNGIDLGKAKTRQVQIGMSICGVFAAMGEPDTVNSTETMRGTSYQVIYRDRGIYLYGDISKDGNLIIHSIQR